MGECISMRKDEHIEEKERNKDQNNQKFYYRDTYEYLEGDNKEQISIEKIRQDSKQMKLKEEQCLIKLERADLKTSRVKLEFQSVDVLGQNENCLGRADLYVQATYNKKNYLKKFKSKEAKNLYMIITVKPIITPILEDHTIRFSLYQANQAPSKFFDLQLTELNDEDVHELNFPNINFVVRIQLIKDHQQFWNNRREYISKMQQKIRTIENEMHQLVVMKMLKDKVDDLRSTASNEIAQVIPEIKQESSEDDFIFCTKEIDKYLQNSSLYSF